MSTCLAASPSCAVERAIYIEMLTGHRREEVAGMTWAEVAQKLRTYLGTGTENGTAHLQLSHHRANSSTASGPKVRCRVQRSLQDRRAKLTLVFPGERGTPFNGWRECKVSARHRLRCFRLVAA